MLPNTLKMVYLKSLIGFLLLSLSVSAQTEIQVILNGAKDHKVDKVDAFDLSQVEYYKYKFSDTLLFRFNKDTIDCYNIRYHENGKMYRQQIWLNPGKVIIKAHIGEDKLIIDTVINSSFYYQVTEFNEKYASLLKARDSTGTNDFLLTSFKKNFDNPFSIHVGLFFITQNQNNRDQLLRLKALTDSQGSRFSWFLLYPMVSVRLEKLLTVKKIDLERFSFLNEQKKKSKIALDSAAFYVIDCWFLSCLPCVAQHKEIKENVGKLRSRNIEVIGVSTDRDWKKWKKYLLEHEYSWRNFLEDKSMPLTKELGISIFPTYIVLNKNGDILDTYNSFKEVLIRFHIND